MTTFDFDAWVREGVSALKALKDQRADKIDMRNRLDDEIAQLDDRIERIEGVVDLAGGSGQKRMTGILDTLRDFVHNDLDFGTEVTFENCVDVIANTVGEDPKRSSVRSALDSLVRSKALERFKPPNSDHFYWRRPDPSAQVDGAAPPGVVQAIKERLRVAYPEGIIAGSPEEEAVLTRLRSEGIVSMKGNEYLMVKEDAITKDEAPHDLQRPLFGSDPPKHSR